MDYGVLITLTKCITYMAIFVEDTYTGFNTTKLHVQIRNVRQYMLY